MAMVYFLALQFIFYSFMAMATARCVKTKDWMNLEFDKKKNSHCWQSVLVTETASENFNFSSCVLENAGMSHRVIHHFRRTKMGISPIFKWILLCFYKFMKLKKPHSKITVKSSITYKKCSHIWENSTGLRVQGPSQFYSPLWLNS